jgi:peroxiredoxin
VALLGTECPIARLYAARLAKLSEEYSESSVAFIGVFPNRHDSITEMAQFARTHGIKFPLLKDLNNQVADRLGADRTPEVFVLDKDRVVRYRGRIDDQYSYGQAQPKAKQDYLVAAVTELLAGKPVTTPRTEAVGCRIGRARTPDENAEVTYAKQISRILNARCVRCHRKGEIAPMALTDYSEVAGWAEMIEEVVREQRMPPWHANPKHGTFMNDPQLSDAEKELIYRWVAAGAPEGNPRDRPDPPRFTEGWQIGTPDQVIYTSDEPFLVPATGSLEYEYFVVDPGWKEDKWIQATECRPGNRGVVHHFLITAHSDRVNPFRTLLRIADMVPGSESRVYPPGFAIFVPADSKLVFEMHYTPIGSEQSDRSCLGLIFADPKTVTNQVALYELGSDDFAIPPEAPNHKVQATRELSHDLLLLSLWPHMHVRGKSFRFAATYPDGRNEILLDVPRYDFNWQHNYELAEPKMLPKGTQIHCVAHFDNSPRNIANPDPTQTVRSGEQTWDEMMVGFFGIAVPRFENTAAVEAISAGTSQ